MILDEPYNAWLIKNVGDSIDENIRFLVQVNATTSEGAVTLNVPLDLTWFILLYSKDTDQIKLDVVLELLKKPQYAAQFKATIQIHDAKRLMAEFLLFNQIFLERLAPYIDFSLLDIPLDMITHALLIKLNNDMADSPQMCKQRIKNVNVILNTGFVLKDPKPGTAGLATHKLLLMEIDNSEKFALIKRLLSVGFELFGENAINNNETAVSLIADRNIPTCLEIINSNAEAFATLIFTVAGNGSNIADYYYWVKEDMDAVNFIRSTLKIDITP